ncbi:gamma-glutamylcyclotransferase family protein [Brachybacterium sacelli]|nr:gamma-glutamylcyclotransferase family protein [Brachybacterium sacelli]
MQRLFVYGTLVPGRPNEHVPSEVDGRGERGSVRGYLREHGWGATLGYPAIVLAEDGQEVSGMVLSSEDLAEHWGRLDDFEGEGYARVDATVRLADGTDVQAQIYQAVDTTMPAQS